MIAQRPRATATAYGSPTFAAHLAAREAALGIPTPETPCVITQGVTQANPETGMANEGASDPDASPPPMGDMGQQGSRDAWGNAITSAPRLDGAYTFTSRTWEPGGRTVYVCGSPAAHVAGGYWVLDGRMSAGQGYVCARCWADVARQWGTGREWRR